MTSPPNTNQTNALLSSMMKMAIMTFPFTPFETCITQRNNGGVQNLLKLSVKLLSDAFILCHACYCKPKTNNQTSNSRKNPQKQTFKVLGYGNYNCFKEIDSCLGLSETKCLGKPVFWGVSKLHSEGGRAGLQVELKVSKLFMEPA